MFLDGMRVWSLKPEAGQGDSEKSKEGKRHVPEQIVKKLRDSAGNLHRGRGVEEEF